MRMEEPNLAGTVDLSTSRSFHQLVCEMLWGKTSGEDCNITSLVLSILKAYGTCSLDTVWVLTHSRIIFQVLPAVGSAKHISADWGLVVVVMNQSDDDVDFWLKARLSTQVPYFLRPCISTVGSKPSSEQWVLDDFGIFSHRLKALCEGFRLWSCPFRGPEVFDWPLPIGT